MHNVFRRFCCGLILAFPCIARTQDKAAPTEQQARVILFTPGGHWRGMGDKLNPFAAKANTISNGYVFDGDVLLAGLSHSRYVVLRIKPGLHTLSASRMGNHADSKQAVALDLKPGAAYYFAITTTVPSVLAGIGPLETSHIHGVSCNDLQAELQKDRLDPADVKLIGDAYRSSIDDDFDLSTCKR